MVCLCLFVIFISFVVDVPFNLLFFFITFCPEFAGYSNTTCHKNEEMSKQFIKNN